MPGFFLSNIGSIDLKNEFDDRCLQESFWSGEVFCARNTLRKFLDDKAFHEDEDCIFIAEGVLLNKTELFEEHGVSSMVQLVKRLRQNQRESFFECFRGPFSGAFYDKDEKTWVVYTSHCGDNPVFCYTDEQGRFAFGSQVNYLLDVLRAGSIEATLHEPAVYAMLSYGFMVDESTYVREVKRLLPGHCAIVNEGRCEFRTYYRPKENAFDLSSWSEEQIIEELDRLFIQAVRREFDKDDEYGYRHLCDLSGGLDSRMTTWVAHELGYRNCTNVTYCQAGYVDQTVAQSIASDLGNEFFFKSLDDARFMFDADTIIRMNFGLGLYSGITGGERLLRSLNLDEFGLEHTGQIGDVVVGTFVSDITELHPVKHAGSYSNAFLEKLGDPSEQRYLDQEQYLMETRAFLGALSTHLIRRNYAEVASPFLDVDFFDFCLGIPCERRAKHALYKKWIMLKHPRAAGYVWEKEGIPVSASLGTRIAARVKSKLRAVRIMLSGRGPLTRKDGSMNPIDYWYSSNAALREWMEQVAGSASCFAESSMGGVLMEAFDGGSVTGKTQAITAMGAIALYGLAKSDEDSAR